LRLIKKCPPEAGEIWIAASGLKSAEDLRLAREAGFGAVLVGTSLMAAADPEEALKALISNI
jgi:indole-3-glycerol phosphate synthase